MPKRAKELSVTEINRLSFAVSKDGKQYNALHAVGGVAGLMLQVTPNNAKSWIYRAQVGVKRRNIGLGAYPDVPLIEARKKARLMQDNIREGRDPVEERRASRQALINSQLSSKTFEWAAREFLKTKKFRSPRSSDIFIRSLENHAFPHIGKLLVHEIELAHIKQVLDPIWDSKPETAKNVQRRIENILSYCSVHQYRDNTNPARWKGFLSTIYTHQDKLDKGHYTALDIEAMPEFMQRLQKQSGTAARALEFLILTASRTNEVAGDKRIGKHGITWGEVDFKTKVWTIPAVRMKKGIEHRVPLTDPAIKILQSLPVGAPEDQIFSGRNGEIPSNNFLSAVLKGMGVDVTTHGFRSTFKDWAREFTEYDDEVSELSLAHINSDATRAAYRRKDMIDKRRLLMSEWAQFCNHGLPEAKSDNVVEIGGRRNVSL